MENTFNLIELIRLLYRWRKAILITCSVAVIGSIIISLLLPDYYASSAIFFPTNPEMTDRQNLFRLEAADVPVSSFGKERDADRLLQIAKSSQLAAFIIQQFDLFKHYDINPENTKYPEYEVHKEFSDNYEVFKNEYGAIEIHFMDVDKEMAANISNAIMDKIDQVNNDMIRDNNQKILSVMEKKLAEKKQEVDKLADSLTVEKQKYNIVDIKKQSEVIAAGAGLKEADPKLKRFMEGLEKLRILENMKDNAVKELNTISTLYDQYLAASGQKFPSVYVLERAYPAEKKSKPVRWLIVTASLLLSLLVSVVAVALIEKTRTISL